MNTPTALDVRSWSLVDFGTKGYPAQDPDPLALPVEQANAYVAFVTARSLDSTMPALLEPLAKQAVRMRTEQIVMGAQEDTVETAGDVDLIGSFTAGSYSESRHDPTRRGEQRQLNPWPQLDELLWVLLGLVPGETNAAVDERRSYWRYILGLQPNLPAWQIVETNWRDNGSIAYGTPLAPAWSIY